MHKSLSLTGRFDGAVRLAKFLWRQRFGRIEVPNQPHFDDASTAWFLSRLARSRFYLEFGSGGSTVAAAAHCIPTLSVENDRFFARAVRRQIADPSRLQMLAVNIGLTREWGFPVFTRPTQRRRQKWRRYIDRPFAAIAHGALGFPDLVLVDGRFRRACALQVARQANLAGARVTLCVDDYGRRPSLRTIEPLLGTPAMHGRMAVFEIEPAGIAISDEAVEEAIGDYR